MPPPPPHPTPTPPFQCGGNGEGLAVALIENSSRCPTNEEGEKVVPPADTPWIVDVMEKVSMGLGLALGKALGKALRIECWLGWGRGGQPAEEAPHEGMHARQRGPARQAGAPRVPAYNPLPLFMSIAAVSINPCFVHANRCFLTLSRSLRWH